MSEYVQVVEIKCKECGFSLWSNDPDEIEEWRDLHHQGALKGSICDNEMEFVGEVKHP